MNIEQTISEITTLSIGDRLRLVHAIWDTLPKDAALVPTPGQQAGLDRRLAEHQANPETAISHEELMRRVGSRR